MKNTPTFLLIAALSVGLSACGKKDEEPSVTQQDVENATVAAQAETEQKLGSQIAASVEDAKKAGNEAVDKAKAEMEVKLAEQAKTLTAQYEASNKALRDQVDSLTKQFEASKSVLPKEVAEPIQEKLPVFQSSVQTLESMVSSFSPSTMEQFEDFKTKYEKELGIAKKTGEELMKLLANTEFGKSLPSF